MPYSHAGEIGDIWKHLALCEILRIESPVEYMETHSASAQYVLPRDERRAYGIFHFWEALDQTQRDQYQYLKIIRSLDTVNTRRYYGSPALAMTFLGSDCRYTFFDVEQPALDSVATFAQDAGLKAKTICEDSVAALMQKEGALSPDTLVFLDPYLPFEKNSAGNDVFNVLQRLCQSEAKIVLWYGYDSLAGQRAIRDRLRKISVSAGKGSVHTFDIWQSWMDGGGCTVNPGVPGCGLALCHLSEESVEITLALLEVVREAYRDVPFGGVKTSILSQHHQL